MDNNLNKTNFALIFCGSVNKAITRKSPAPHSSLRQRVFLLRACVVVGCALRLQPHAAGDSQRSSNSGQDGDQRLDNGFPDCFLVHFVN